MLQIITPEQVAEMNENLAKWFKRELKREHGSYLYNLVSGQRHHIEEVRRIAGIDTCSNCGKEFKDKTKFREHLGIHFGKFPNNSRPKR